MEWTLLQDDVAANFSSDSTDGWDGDYMKIFFSNGIKYACHLGGTVDLPHSPYHVSQCSEGTVGLYFCPLLKLKLNLTYRLT